jgi:hypothetical protein
MATISVAVANATNTEATWTITCGSTGACGSFGIGNGNPNYTTQVLVAPEAIPSGKTITVTATSIADPTKSVSATVTITASIALYGVAPAALQVGRAAPIAALVGPFQNADPNAQIKWTLSCGGADCGSFSPTVTFNELSTTYTAPSTIPPGGRVTVTATSAADPTQSVSTAIVISPTVAGLPDGSYVFTITSWLNAGTFTTGVFTVQGGVITGGEQDSNSITSQTVGGPYQQNPQFQQITGGSSAVTADGNLQILLNYQTNSGNLIGSETLSGAPVSGSKGFVAQLYGAGGSGTLEMQTATATPTAGYAFSLLGLNKASQSVWMGGILNIDSPGGISGSGSALDVVVLNNESSLALNASTVSGPDSYGRAVFKLSPADSGAPYSLYLAGYVVDSSHIRLIEPGGDSYGGSVAGLALGQGANTGQFTASSNAGSSYVFGMTGFGQSGDLQVAGVLTANSGGTVTGKLAWANLGGQGAAPPRSFTGTWTIDPTGRVTLTNLADGTANLGSSFTYDLELYLTGDGNGLLLSTNAAAVELAGQAFEQQSGTLDAASFTGTYGFTSTGSGLLFGSVASVAGSGMDTLTGFADAYAGGNADFGISGSFSDESNGILTGTFTGFGSGIGSSAPTTNTFYLYMIDDTRAVGIETDGDQYTLVYLARP